jgi:inner membrane protein involved in colicin E2 resistance
VLQWGIGLVIDYVMSLGYSEVTGFRVAIFILMIINILSYLYFVIKNLKN